MKRPERAGPRMWLSAATLGVILIALHASAGVSLGAEPSVEVEGCSPLVVWVGLANSDDVGQYHDFMANVWVGEPPVWQLLCTGEIFRRPGGSSGFNNAVMTSIPLDLVGSGYVGAQGGQLKVDVFVRQSCLAPRPRYCIHDNECRSRFWYNDRSKPTYFDLDLEFDGDAGYTDTNFYLRDTAFTLSTAPGTGPRMYVDTGIGPKPPNCVGTTLDPGFESYYRPIQTWSGPLTDSN